MLRGMSSLLRRAQKGAGGVQNTVWGTEEALTLLSVADPGRGAKRAMTVAGL